MKLPLNVVLLAPYSVTTTAMRSPVVSFVTQTVPVSAFAVSMSIGAVSVTFTVPPTLPLVLSTDSATFSA